MLQFLQHDDIRIMSLNLFNRRLDIDLCVIRIRLIPHLTKLHVKLKYSQAFHTRHQRAVAEETFTTGNLRSGNVDFSPEGRTIFTVVPERFLETEYLGRTFRF